MCLCVCAFSESCSCGKVVGGYKVKWFGQRRRKLHRNNINGAGDSLVIYEENIRFGLPHHSNHFCAVPKCFSKRMNLNIRHALFQLIEFIFHTYVIWSDICLTSFSDVLKCCPNKIHFVHCIRREEVNKSASWMSLRHNRKQTLQELISIGFCICCDVLKCRFYFKCYQSCRNIQSTLFFCIGGSKFLTKYARKKTFPFHVKLCCFVAFLTHA